MLPDASAAQVEIAKVEAYLLSPSHPVGRAKAAFFFSLGFAPERPTELVEALQAHARFGEVVDQIRSEHGTKYVIEGLLVGPNAKAGIRSVWIATPGGSGPRLVTAYPTRHRGQENA